MSWGAVAAVGGSIVGGVIAGKGSKDAAQASAAASDAGVRENRRQFDTVLNLQAPAINTGNVARSQLASILGLEVPGSTYSPGGTTTGQDARQMNPFLGAGGFSLLGGILAQRRREQADSAPATGTNTPLTFTTPASSPMSAEDIQSRLESFPGYRFAVDQATRAAQAMGSATGSLGGNVVSALADRVGGGIAMPTFQNYLNQLQSLSGGAQTATNAASGAAINTGGLVAQGLQNAGDARAGGILGQARSIGGILSGLGDAFQGSRGSLPTSGFTPYTGNPYGNSIPFTRP